MAFEASWNPGLWTAAGGWMRADWDLVPFGDLLESPKSMSVGVMYPGKPVGQGIPLIRVGDVKEGGVVGTPEMQISPEVHHEYRRTELIGDELLITLVGKPGVCVIARPNMRGWNIARALAAAKLREPRLRAYLKAVFESSVMKNIILSMLNTTVQPTLNLKEIRTLPIPMPRDVEDAFRIGEVAERFNQRVALLSSVSSTIESIAQAIFKSWFIDFDPVSAKAEGREPEGMDAATAALFPSGFEESELGLIPRGWRVQRLDETMEINPPRNLRKGVAAPYLEMANAPTSGHRPLAAIVARELGTGAKFIGGDTLLAKITPCLENGKTAFVDFLSEGEVGWGSTEFIVLRPRAPVPAYFGYLLARHEPFRQYAIQAMTGTSGRQRVELGRLAQYRLVVPDEAVWNAFAATIEPIRLRIAEADRHAKTLGGIRDALLPRLVSGKQLIPDAQALMQEAVA